MRLGGEDSLLRLFRSELFDSHFHMFYLFKRKEEGVHEYLVHLLYTRRNIADINYYLPQLCQLALTRSAAVVLLLLLLLLLMLMLLMPLLLLLLVVLRLLQTLLLLLLLLLRVLTLVGLLLRVHLLLVFD